MEKKTVSAVMLTLLLMSILTLAFNIQPVKAEGTIYIRADGSVDPPDAPISSADNITYTLTDNIVEVPESSSAVIVERNNIVVDGAGYTVQGPGSGNGIKLYQRSNVTIKNTQIKEFQYGIYLDSSSNNSIAGNNITNNSFGIRLYSSCNYNTVSGNKITNNNEHGIYLCESSNNSFSGNNITNNIRGIEFLQSSNNTVSGNNITANNGLGIHLGWSSNNVLRNNIMAGNRYNFEVEGSTLSHFIHDVDISNTVDGKPVYYLINQKNLVIGPFTYPNIGYLALVNSTDITVEGLELKNNYQGTLFAYTTNSQITNNNITNNFDGIYLYSSSDNTVSGNSLTNNAEFGIYLYSSCNYNTVSGNKITNNSFGILLYESSNNSFSGNNITNNDSGIWLGKSSNNSIYGNNITANYYYGINLHLSSNNKFYHNNFIDNTQQVYVYNSMNVWDDGYPSGGNYWSDYSSRYPGVGDEYQGENQDILGSDGIWDHPYEIDELNKDNYPLVNLYTPIIEATIEIDPDTLNLKSNGEWITAYIELPKGYDVSNIDVPTIQINGTIPIDVEAPITVGDYDLDNIPDLMVKFDRVAVIQWLNTNDFSEDTGKYFEINLTVAGTVAETRFTGTDKIKVLKR